ncbi:MAG TPA: PIN domain-containing protein [Rhizomicrobium sp.]
MDEILTLDANVLVYSQDTQDSFKHAIANELIAGLRHSNAILTALTLGEFFNAAARKFITPTRARQVLEDFSTLVPVVSYEPHHLLRAAAEVEVGRFSFWDAVMLSCAEDAGCTICLSEDMSDGARLGNIVVRNPFGPRGLNDEVRAFLQP